MNTNKVNRGSEWRKWDLHVHTPLSIEQEYGGNTPENWERFISDLERLPSEIKVIGINDYIFIDGYKKVLDEKQKGRLSNIELILPVIELRIDKFANVSEDDPLKRINFHIIFSNELTSEQIESQFLNALSAEYKLETEYDYDNESDWGGVITRENIELLGKKLIESSKGKIKGSPLKIGFNSLNIPYEKLMDKLKNPLLKNKFLTAVGKVEWDTMRWDGSPAEKKNIINRANFVFSASPTVELAVKARESLKNQNVNHKLLHCSDAHTFINNLQNTKEKELGHCFTWIKADPTFEGLRQTIYEPEERVKIQENNPKLDYDKPYFLSIIFRNDENIFKDEELYFDKSTQEIPLNPNLVAIIGGRGEGKSMLMKYISTSFAIKTIETDEDFLKSENIEVIYSKTIKNEEELLPFPINNTKHSLDFIYISQGELKNIVEKKEKLAEGISKMADIKEFAFDQNLDKEVSDKLEELHNIVVFLEDSQNNLKKLQEQENTQRQFIENITTKENKEKLEQYTKILGDINIETDKKIQLLNLKNIFSQEEINLNENITSINQKYSLDIPTIQKEQIFKLQLEKIEELLKSIEEHFISLNQEKERIKNEFSQFYTGDLTTLLKDVDKYQSELSLISDKIERVNEAIEKKRNLIKVIFEDIENQLSLISKIKAEYNKQEKSILEDWEKFKNIEQREDLNPQQKKIMQTLLQDLDIEAVTEFNKEAFYNEIYHCINGAGWRIKNNQKAQEEYFGINDLDSFFNFLKEKYLEASSINGIHRDVLRATLFNEEYRQKYIKVYPILKYKGKNLDKISIGQKGTVYLKMKLATEAFSKPIIFDQPEDDLDNQFIIKELVDLFKELKKYRQVIIITHNANLVINADAEQVIIAKNDNERLKYSCGSLENSNINKQICEILEGGKEAFEKRERKYRF